jgi:hypothetical protein
LFCSFILVSAGWRRSHDARLGERESHDDGMERSAQNQAVWNDFKLTIFVTSTRHTGR